MDQLTCIIALLCKAARDKGAVEIPCGKEKVLRGKLHHDWNIQNMKCLVSTLDLKDAYKQLGINARDRNKSIVALKCSRSLGVKLYSMNCLPFGATAAVHCFNRFSRMLWAFGVRELRIPWLNYFDDYPILAMSGIQDSTMASAKTMMRLMGVAFAESKLAPFAEQAEVLGLNIDCSDASNNSLKIRMKETRRTEILEAIDRFRAL